MVGAIVESYSFDVGLFHSLLSCRLSGAFHDSGQEEDSLYLILSRYPTELVMQGNGDFCLEKPLLLFCRCHALSVS
jgi:hypothetical protein